MEPQSRHRLDHGRVPEQQHTHENVIRREPVPVQEKAEGQAEPQV